MEVAVKISSQYNNQFFHMIVPELVKNLSSNEFTQTKGYEYFREAFSEYYMLEKDQALDGRITALCEKFSHPLDQQVLLGPVLRLTLKKVLKNDEYCKNLFQESFKASESNAEWEKAYEIHVNNLGDLGQCQLISFDKLKVLCRSFNFVCKNVEDTESKFPESEKPIATIKVKKNANDRWEFADGEIKTERQSVFNDYHKMSCYVLEIGADSYYLNNLQNLFRKKINQTCLKKQEYFEETYTVLPSHHWESLNGLIPLVEILCQEITGEKKFTRKNAENQEVFLQDTPAMTDFVLKYSEYYQLDKGMKMPELMARLKNLLRDYPLPKERLMIMGPVLERMNSLPVLYQQFGIALDIYAARQNSKKTYCYDKMTELYKDETKCFTKAAIQTDGKSYQALNLNEFDNFTWSQVVAQHSLPHAFYFNQDMSIMKQRNLVKFGIQHYHEREILYCYNDKEVSLKLQLSNASLLHEAIESNQIDSVKKMISNGVDWRKTTAWTSPEPLKYEKVLPKEINALELAAYYGNRAMVTLLLNNISSDEEKESIQSAYNIACHFAEANMLVPFLRYSWLEHSPKAFRKAIVSKDLGLFDQLGPLEKKKTFIFQNQEKLMTFSFNMYAENKTYSFSLMEMVLYFKHQESEQFTLNEKMSQFVREVFEKGGEAWVKNFIISFNEIILATIKEEESKVKAYESFQKVIEAVAKKACDAIESKNEEGLKTCIETSEQCLYFPGKYNPLHYAFDKGEYPFIESAYIENFDSREKAQSRLKAISKIAYDKRECSLEFKQNRLQYKNDLDQKLATTDSFFSRVTLKAARLKFSVGSAIYDTAYRFHEKKLHQEKIHQSEFYKYGYIATLLLRGLGTLSSDGVIRYGLNFAKAYVPNIIQRPIQYVAGDLCGKVASRLGFDPITGKRYMPVFFQNGLTFVFFPQYYLASTVIDYTVYTMFYGRGYDNTEALFYVAGDVLANAMSTDPKTNYQIDERYTYRLGNNLKPFFGETLTPYLVSGISTVDGISINMHNMLHEVLKQAGQLWSQHVLTQNILPFDFQSIAEQFISLTERFKNGVETVQSYYNKYTQLQEQIFNCVEATMLEQLSDSIYKNERLHVLKTLEIYQLQIEGLSIQEQLDEAREQENAELISELEKEFAGHQEILAAAKVDEQLLFEKTEGYQYYNDWLKKFSDLKYAEYTPNTPAVTVEALKQAEMEAEQKARFYNSNIVNASIGAHKDFYNALFEEKKLNFMDSACMATTLDNLINAGYDDYSTDRNALATYLAYVIIRYKHPLYPECGDVAAIEREREQYINEISTYELSGLSSHKNRTKRRVYDYVYAKMTDTPKKEHVSRLKDAWEYSVNEIGKEFGYTPYEDRSNSLQHGGSGSFYIGYNPGKGPLFEIKIKDVPIVKFYPRGVDGPSMSHDFHEGVMSKKKIEPVSTQVDMPSFSSFQSISSVPVKVSPGMHMDNPYIQSALKEPLEAFFEDLPQSKSDAKREIGEQFKVPVQEAKMAEHAEHAKKSASKHVSFQEPYDDRSYTTKEKVIIGMGRGFTKIGQGIKQLGLKAGEKVHLIEEGATAEYTKKINEESEFYENTSVGQSMAGKVGEVLAETASALAVPGAAGARGVMFVADAAASGALMGALMPTEDGSLESRAQNAAKGAVEGAVGGIVVNKAGKVMQPLFDKTKAKAVDKFTTKVLEVKKPIAPLYDFQSKSTTQKAFDSVSATSTVSDFKELKSYFSSTALDGMPYPVEKMPVLARYLEKRGVLVHTTNGEPRFKARETKLSEMYLPANASVLQVKHELSHWLDFKRLGFEKFASLSTYEREKMVLDRLQANRLWKDLNQMEKNFSIHYVAKIKDGYVPGSEMEKLAERLKMG